MKLFTTLAASIALALVPPAFAQQDTTPSTDPMPPSSSMSSDMGSGMNDMGSAANDQQTAPTTHHRNRHRAAAPASDANTVSNSPAYNANTAAMNGSEPGVAAYQRSARMKRYPAVDHGHVRGDPPVIDHSGDQTTVDNPTHTSITVPPGQP